MGRKRKRKPEIEYEVCDLPITSLGGLPVIWDLAEALGLEELFNKNLKIKMRKRGYSEYQMAMAIILTFIAGGESLEDADKIRLDEVVSGSPFPHSTTVGDFLRRFEAEELNGLIRAGRLWEITVWGYGWYKAEDAYPSLRLKLMLS